MLDSLPGGAAWSWLKCPSTQYCSVSRRLGFFFLRAFFAFSRPGSRVSSGMASYFAFHRSMSTSSGWAMA
ncbi:hypothetical protein [Tautonia plasticadhaerens]|uniref:hypothetical protein n=1 Tax=Tautonia plasticadhaerens TaxID=2527974 RepID=UPI001E3EFB33|nr:hypothetical protein [Tautonia plasticadhaerens]